MSSQWKNLITDRRPGSGCKPGPPIVSLNLTSHTFAFSRRVCDEYDLHAGQHVEIKLKGRTVVFVIHAVENEQTRVLREMRGRAVLSSTALSRKVYNGKGRHSWDVKKIRVGNNYYPGFRY